MFRQSMVFTPPVHGSDVQPQPHPSLQPPNVTESQQIGTYSPVKSHQLHNFPLSDLRWTMNHTNTHRLRKASGRSPLCEANTSKVREEINEASGSSSFELKPAKNGISSGVSDSTSDRPEMKSIATDNRSKIFIRIRRKNNEKTAHVATAVHETDEAAVTAIERISDGGGQETDEFGVKTWNLRPREKKRSIGHSGGLKSCNGGSLKENKAQGTVITESIRSRNGTDLKIATTEKKPRLIISLSKMEIDEDIYALTGSKPSRRPKKRSKNIQKQLDVIFPGLWMGNVSSNAYKISDHV